MSRSGYSDDYDGDNWSMICWRGAVKKAMTGKRGQALFIALRDAFDAMPVKKLAGGSFHEADGCKCSLGVLGDQRGIDLSEMEKAADCGHYEKIGDAFDSSRALVQEIMWMNDDGCWAGRETPSERWSRMRSWVADQITAREQTP